MKIKKGDTVKIISGKDRGKTARIVRVIPKLNKIVVDGINMRNKHVRPKKQGEKGQKMQIAAPVSAASVMLVCPSCKKAVRTSVKKTGENKTRICKKCDANI